MLKEKFNYGFIVQLMGILGIIGSLIFVGLEMRQTQKIAIASQHQSRSALTTQTIRAMDDKGIDFQSVYFEQKIRLYFLTY